MSHSPAAYEFRNEHPDFQEANKAVHSFCSKIQSERRAIRFCLARIGTLDSVDDLVNNSMFAHEELSDENDLMLETVTGNNREVWGDKMCTGRDCIMEMQLKLVHDIVNHENQIKKLKRQQDQARVHADAVEERLLKEFKDAQNTKEKQKV